MTPDICIYHAPCQDGFTAAWAIWRRWPQCQFVPAHYGAPPPDVEGKHVLIVDFSYKRPVLEEMGRRAATITVLDHHKSAEIDLSPFAILNPVNADTIEAMIAATQPGLGNIRAQFDMNWSGAHLAWNFAFPDIPPPAIIRHVEDRDLWRFDLPFTREIAADLFSRPYSFEEWSTVADLLASAEGFRMIVAAGEAIERKHHKDIAELLRLCTRDMVIGGIRVKAANMPYTLSSDAAGALAEGMPFGACWYENSEGRRVFSLRSRDGGIDVSEVAVSYGGGGHARAAGFTAPPGWDFDPEDLAACPICLAPFTPDDICASDIELSTCHAACLEGSPTVDLATGEPRSGPIPTFRYGDDQRSATGGAGHD